MVHAALLLSGYAACQPDGRKVYFCLLTATGRSSTIHSYGGLGFCITSAKEFSLKRSLRDLFALAFLVLAPHSLCAQSISGTILGSVQDTTGAAVPGASVTIVNGETGLTRVATDTTMTERVLAATWPGYFNKPV